MTEYREHINDAFRTHNLSRIAKLFALAAVAAVISSYQPARVMAQAATAAAEIRDGQHDFDFKVGVWRTHILRTVDPFSETRKSMELNGTVTVRKVWEGRGALEEIEADGPNGHWEGLTLFLYNPTSHQWSQSFINSAMGELSAPLIGSFKDGIGEMFSQDTLHGKFILVRGKWSDITAHSHRYEESYSNDGGKTWAVAFNADLTREEANAENGVAASAPMNEMDAGVAREGSHDFDFDLGVWKTHSTRLMHPLTGSKQWVDLDGETVNRKVWGGRANLAEYNADGPTGHLELLALRWFNPKTQEWNIDFATPQVGILGNPGVGSFKNGRGDFFDYEPINGRSVLVRFSIWRITDDTAQSEQAFSDDGGKTWEVNWVNKYTRIRKD